jgi:hypothetical protein
MLASIGEVAKGSTLQLCDGARSRASGLAPVIRRLSALARDAQAIAAGREFDPTSRVNSRIPPNRDGWDPAARVASP